MRQLGRQFAVFFVVGGITAVVHYGLLVALKELAGVDPVVASACGFVLGGILNYALNYRLTFRSAARHASAFPRFATVAGLGLLLNTALMEALVHGLSVHYVVAQVATTAALMLWHFAANRLWTFAARQPRS